MSIYINELAPWERKNEYYKVIQLGNDVQKQTELISKASKSQIKTQLQNTHEIIASNDRIANYMENLSDQMNGVSAGIQELKSVFEWGISEVIWQIEQNREVLKSIEEGIWHPFDVQARNRKKQAQEAYSNGWIDEAEEYFKESEKIVKTDFTVHLSLGMIYMFHKINKNTALDHFEKAARYATPKSSYYKSYALLYKSMILFDFEKTNDAELVSQEAIETSPDFIHLYYQNAIYNAQLGNKQKALIQLKHAILNDRLYAIKANSESLFEPIRSDILKLIQEITIENCAVCEKKIESTKKIVHLANSATVDLEKKYRRNFQGKNFSPELSSISNLLKKGNYFDSTDAKEEIEKLKNSIVVYLTQFNDEVTSIIKSIHLKKAELWKKAESKNEGLDTSSMIVFGIAGFFISCILGFKGCNAILETNSDSTPLGTQLGSLIVAPIVMVVIIFGGTFLSLLISKGFSKTIEVNYKEETTQLDVNIKELQKSEKDIDQMKIRIKSI